MAEVSKLNFGEGGGNRDIKDAKAFRTDDATETALADSDTFPFYDASASAKKKSTWSNLVAKIKSAFGIESGSTFLKKDGSWATPDNNRKSFFGTCNTAAATAAKVVTLSDTTGWELKAGTIIGVKFTNSNTASSVTLNVNSSGAKSIFYNGSVYTGTATQMTGQATHVTFYMYDGTNWVFLNHDANYRDSNTWTANSSSNAGYVASGANQINKAWRTDGSGNPSWRSVPTNRKFIIIGDSFGYGIRGGSQSWASTGWIYYFASLFPNQTIWYDYGQEQAEGVSAFTTTDPTPGTGFETTLLWLKNNKMGNIAPEEITDVVVIGGNNHDTEASYADIVTAVEHFIDTARANFPNANIKIGCFGISAQLQCIKSSAYKGIRQGTLNKGAEFLSDLELLGCQWSWDSGYGHLTEEGYVTCVPYIAQCIISGHTHYCFVEVIPLTVNTSHVSTDAALNFRLCIERTEKYFNIWVNDDNKYYGYYLNNKINKTGSIDCTAFNPQNSNARIKVPFRNGVFFDHMDVFNRVSGQYLCIAGKGKMYLTVDTNERFTVHCTLEYYFSGVSPTYSNIRFSWEGMGGIIQPLDRILQ